MENHTWPIFHLTPAGYYHRHPPNHPYRPETFTQDGFIHCTSGRELLIKIANTFFVDLLDTLLVLEIDPARLTAPLKFEPPIPPANIDSTGNEDAADLLFPHIYGPLNREAIIRTFALQRDEMGQWQMPD